MALRGTAAAVVLLAAGVAGCASAELPAVTDVAARFAADVDRCGLLAPATLAEVEQLGRTPCAGALPALPGGEVVSAEVWGDAARVSTSHDTLFLVRTDAGARFTTTR